MSEKIRRNVSGMAELRAGDEGEPRKIYGVAAVFDSRSENLGGFTELIDRAAFDSTDMGNVFGLFNHDPNIVLGRSTNGTLDIKVTSRGLEYTITPPDTSQARDCCALLAGGFVDQSSFAFRVAPGGRSWDEDEENGALITTVTAISRLDDVSPVTYPAYTATSSGMRAEAASELKELYADYKNSIDTHQPGRGVDEIRLLEAELTAYTRGY